MGTSHARAYHRLGYDFEVVGLVSRGAESRQALEHAVRLAPKEARGWVALASLLVELEERADYDTDALVALDRAVLLNPEDARAWYMRAQLCERRDDRTGALNSLTRALALDEARRGDARWDFGDLSGEPGFRELLGD